MNQALLKGDTIIRHVVGLAFIPSPELKAVKGLTWANDERHHWYVATREGRMVACVGLLHRGWEARFKTDAVIPDFRGQGIYRLLFNLREGLAETLGCTEATTFSNAQSRPMYVKAGFTSTAKENPNGVLYMRKPFVKRGKSW